MSYTKSGRLIKYLFYCKGFKKGDILDTPSITRFYKKLDKAKQILENARPTRAHERKFMLAMDRLDDLLCDIEKHDKKSDIAAARVAWLRNSEKERQWKAHR